MTRTELRLVSVVLVCLALISVGCTHRKTSGGLDAQVEPVCTEDNEAMCALLFECCESINLLPPIRVNCLDVADRCDGRACEDLLSGYVQCPQPPLCPTDEDPEGVCELLNQCCNAIDVVQSERVTCLDTAAKCTPDDCNRLLATYSECSQLTAPDAGIPAASSSRPQ